MRERFWEKFSLGELNNREWEALCDGCGQCCLKRRVDAGVVTVYGVACALLDIETSRCSDYSNRLRRVPSCHDLTPTTVPEVEGWLPETCAYRRLHNNEPLPPWHPLLAGDRARMRKKGITVSHYALHSGTLSRRQKERHIVSRWSVGKQRRQQAERAARDSPEGKQQGATSRNQG